MTTLARLLPMTAKELHRRIRMVRERGFRCTLYYFDALACEDAVPEFHSDWIWRDAGGAPKTWDYWEKRPDSKGHTNYMLNPAHPEVRQWFIDYTKALIAEFGGEIDGLVWDETHAVQQGATAKLGSSVIEADRAMMRLVADVAQEVQRGWNRNPDLALLTFRQYRCAWAFAGSRLSVSSPTARTRTVGVSPKRGCRACCRTIATA